MRTPLDRHALGLGSEERTAEPRDLVGARADRFEVFRWRFGRDETSQRVGHLRQTCPHAVEETHERHARSISPQEARVFVPRTEGKAAHWGGGPSRGDAADVPFLHPYGFDREAG